MKKNVGLIVIILIILSLVGLAIFGSFSGAKHHKAIIEMEDGKQVVIELYQDVAPETVANFVSLAKSGFYDGLTFHRIVKDTLIQGGDPAGNGTGGSNKTVTGEFYSNNGFKNYVSHIAGTISMARGQDYNSASSQFFITASDCTQYDGEYAAFGRVIEGQDIINELANLETTTDEDGNSTETPTNAPVIKTIKIEKYSIEYDNTDKYDETTMAENLNSNSDDSAINLEDLYYQMFEQEGYTKNADGTLSDESGKAYTLEELINESYYKSLEQSGYTRNADGTVTDTQGKIFTLDEALNELYSSQAITEEDTNTATE